jgi:RimJ/RimL family protein N-acetyltransferase
MVESSQFPEQLPLKEMNTISQIEEWLRRLQEYWGKGFVMEGAERLLAFGFVEIGAKKIWAGAGD